MRIVRPEIGRADVNTSCETATTAPGLLRFAYVMLVTLFSYTFVMYVLFTMTVFETLTFLT
jgi:hypothetical protein